MDWIFDNFQILALVGLALASWLKTRADAKAAEREERRAREEMAQGPDPDDYGPGEPWQELRMPPRAPQPPPLFRTSPPPVPVAVCDTDAELKRQMEWQERLRLARESKAVTTGGAAATRARTNTPKPGPATSAPLPGLRAELRQRKSLRRAVVLREILGPPLALRR